ncbi:host attachment protein [Salinimonas sediminis]|uniref:Host attachment protein n=1 Tax=Salinimonas sediminis TaxID=2303538 RepID=A0A346NQ54_9ALTE|nr:host attachment protein [Salinimonas sediminis]AXR07661.1 host attachment protein [Salinimonas sediminis]
MLGKSYLVVANQSEAKIFIESDNATSLEPVVVLINDDGREHDSDLVTDRPGATAPPGSNGHGTNTFSRKDAAQIEADRFANTVTDWLDKRRSAEKIYHINIIAEAGFLGKLRNHMSKHVADLVNKTVNKDVVREDEQVWLDYIRQA